MAKGSIKRDYIYNVGYQIMIVLTPLITTPYLSRVLGADGIGRISFAESIVLYFTSFATLGMAVYGQREISYLQNDIEERSRKFWELKVLEIITTAIVLLIYYLFSAFQKKDRSLFFLLSVHIIDVAVNITWFFQGVQEFGKITARNVIFKFASVICIFLFVHTKEDMNIYVIIYAGFVFLGDLSLWFIIPKYIKRPKLSELKPLSNISGTIILFIPTIATKVYSAIDKTMIGIMTASPVENGCYEQASKICRLTQTIVTSLGVVMIPRIGHLYATNNKEGIIEYIYKSYRFVWFIGIPICFGLIGTANNFVPWFLGDGFEQSILLVVVLSFLILTIGNSNVTGSQLLIPTKREKQFTSAVTLGCIINLVLNFILIPSFGSIGAAISSVAAELSIDVLLLYHARREVSIRKMIRCGKNYFFSGGVMLIVLIIIGRRLKPSIINSMIMVVSGMAIYVMILAIIKDSFFLESINAIKYKIITQRKKN